MATPYSQEGLASGPSTGTDPTLVTGQYPDSLFGVDLPQGTGAPGTPGAMPATGGQSVDFTDATGQWRDRLTAVERLSGDGDSTTACGQLHEGISGLGPADVTSTHAGEGHVITPHHPGARS
jgi:hypothetical protein